MSELRANRIHNSWTIIANDRQSRPNDYVAEDTLASCAFCEGNEHLTPPENYAVRTKGTHANSKGWTVRVVPNKYPAVKDLVHTVRNDQSGFLQKIAGTGNHEVIIDSPMHSCGWENQDISHLTAILTVIRQRLNDRAQQDKDKFVLVFKNHGERAGASLEHPHSQCISLPVIPPAFEQRALRAMEYYKTNKRCMLCDMLEYEKQNPCRIVYENILYSGFCPYASRFSFEICVMPKRHNCSFLDAATNDILYLADMLRTVLNALTTILNNSHYNVIFNTHLPTKIGEAGSESDIRAACHWYITIAPRLSPLQGYEWGTGIHVNKHLPENAALQLREHIKNNPPL